MTSGRPGMTRSCLVVGAAIATISVTACSSSTSNSAHTQSSGGAASGVANIAPYAGSEAKLPHTVPTPTKKAGYTFTVGFLNPNSQIPQLLDLQNGVAAQVKTLGGKFVAYNANFSTSTQTRQFNDLLAQHVSAIVAYPLDPTSLSQPVKQANAAGIPVIGFGVPLDLSQPKLAGYATDLTQGNELAGYAIASAVAKEAPGSTFAVLGCSGAQATIQQGQSMKREAVSDGLKFVSEVDSPGDDSTSDAAAASAILARNPNVQTIFAYNSTGAQAAVTVARREGKTHLRVATINSSAAFIQQIASQGLPAFAAVYAPFTQMGTEAANAVYDELTKQHLPLPTRVPLQSSVYTTHNAKSFKGK